MDWLDKLLRDTPTGSPVLIAGATASGKSALALEIARRAGGVVVNADALQVWSCWRILSARPSEAEMGGVPHLLYGHIAPGEESSVGRWLREVAPLLAGPRPIIVGGTGLYFRALTEGLAEVPPTPPELRAEGNLLPLERLLRELDPPTAARLDRANRARVQRAWEVWRATGRGLAAWQDETPPPLLPLSRTLPLLLDAERDWLADRIDRRFEAMLAAGALEEVRAVAPMWQKGAPWTVAHGAPELMAVLRGESELAPMVAQAQAHTRQYAKRQRSWFRARMGGWHRIQLP